MPSDIQQFERTFADLAYAALKSRAPMLMNYLQGWQLVDSSDDETKAVGIFGFKIGDQWVYKPVFFMNGEIKGNELLYLRDQDIFVPMQENWLNYIINRQPFVLGEKEPQTLEEMGYMQPNFSQYVTSPSAGAKQASDDSERREVTEKVARHTKMSSATLPMGCKVQLHKEIVKDAVDLLWGVDVSSKPYKEAAARLRLPAFFKVAGVRAYEAFLESMKRNEKFAEAVFTFYGQDDFANMVSSPLDIFKQGELENDIADRDRVTEDEGSAGSEIKDEQRIDDGTPEVVVIMPGSGELDGVVGDMDEIEQEQLMRGEIVVRDHRDGTSKVIPADIHRNLMSPQDNGVYDVLVRDNEFRKLIVATTPIKPRGGYGDDSSRLVVLDPETKTYGMASPASIFTKKKYDDDSWQKMWDGLSEERSFSRDNVYMFIGPDGDAVQPIRVWEVDKDPAGRTYLRYSLENFCVDNPKSYLGVAPYSTAWQAREARPSGGDSCGPCSPGTSGISLGNVKSKTPRMVGDVLFIPDSWKVVKLNKQLDALRQIQPGTLADITMQISKAAGSYPLKVYHDGVEFHLSSGSAHMKPMSKNAALAALIKRFDMSRDDAEELVKDASRARPGMRPVRVTVLTKRAVLSKLAQPTSLPSNRVSNYATARMPMESNAISGGNVEMDPTMGVPGTRPYSATEQANVPQDLPPEKPFSTHADYDRGNDMKGAIQAAQEGQQDVFDVATIGNLAKMVDIGDIIDKYQSDLMTGMDRIGRILFAFYWHFDKFSDRYGQQDLPDLEDSLKNSFVQIGDLILFLKQKSIDPNMNLGLPLMAGLSE